MKRHPFTTSDRIGCVDGNFSAPLVSGQVAPFAMRFLLTGDNSTVNIAASELMVPATAGSAASPQQHASFEDKMNGIDGVLTLILPTTVPARVGQLCADFIWQLTMCHASGIELIDAREIA